MHKKNCGRTADERKIHEKAVKIRKMTDTQLVDYVEKRVESARNEGFDHGKNMAGKTVREFLILIQQNKISGIGIATINKLTKVAEENGYL